MDPRISRAILEESNPRSTKAAPIKILDLSESKLTWGRAGNRGSWTYALVSGFVIFASPIVAATVSIIISSYEGDLGRFIQTITLDRYHDLLSAYLVLEWNVVLMYAAWIGLQAGLYHFLPGKSHTGQHTPAGHILSYRTNGLQSWILTHVALGCLCWSGRLDVAFVPKNWEAFVVAMNLTGFLLATVSFLKAYWAPTHRDDRKFSGSSLYDFCMGIELNPRIGTSFDLKFFLIGRLGMMSWTVIDLSNIGYQYQLHGRVTLPLIFVTVLHAIYTLDFFFHESWYLRTIDIAHDHLGYYLAWGAVTWVPTMYTLQAQYLSRYPTSADTVYLSLALCFGITGYVIFRSANNQKYTARRTGESYQFRGRPAEYIKATYSTADGRQHKSLLLCSGWWGLSRHANYIGDLMLSTAMCAVTGTGALIVWFYAIFMLVLLVHRCIRDEARCANKYGISWQMYCRRVPWRIIPSIW